MTPTAVLRPDVSLAAILLYALFSFGLGLFLTPWFIAFLRRHRLGKQLRVEAVDGREATIFRKYHEKKFGTPTMGGLLIWGSVFLTILFSRLLSVLGVVDNSLLQRREVYLPLLVLIALGLVGAIDDYFNIVGSNEEQWNKLMPKIKKLFYGGIAVLVLAIGAYFYWGAPHVRDVAVGVPLNFSLGGLLVVGVLFLAAVMFVGAASAMSENWLRSFVTKQGQNRGLSVLPKLTSLLIISLSAALWFYFKLDYNSVFVPFLGPVVIGWWYIPLAVFIILGTANAVNVTDGLDGLAGGLLVISFGAFGLLAYLAGLTTLAAFCGVTAAAIAAFLWHNVPPALFYMGDTGALALGGTLGVLALMTGQILALPLIGAVFVIEMLSVIIQLTSKRFRGGKKVFKAAPIHHHFEALDWGESKVTMRLWIIGAFFAVLGIIVGIYTIKQKALLPNPVAAIEAVSIA